MDVRVESKRPRRLRREVLLVAALLQLAGCGDSGFWPGGRSSPAGSITIAPLSATASDLRRDPGDLLARPVEAGFREVRIPPGRRDANRYLTSGWEFPRPGAHRRWSLGPESTVRFSLDQVQPIVLSLHCFPFHTPDDRPQRIEFWLNGSYLSSLALEPGGHYEVDLPAAALRVGPNFVQLRYEWVAQPMRVFPSSPDVRELAVAFSEIALRAGSQPAPPSLVSVTFPGRDEPRRGLLLEAAAPVSFLVWPPHGSVLELGWLALGSAPAGTAFRIEVEWDAGRRVLHEEHGDARNKLGSARFPLPAEVDGPLRIRLALSELPPSAKWVWIEPRVVAPPASAAPGPPLRAPEHTNVLYFLLDAAARGRFGVYGSPDGTTPNIDALARESLVFDAAFTQGTYTLPSAASLFTSRLPAEHGVLETRDSLSEDWTTLAEALRDAGYTTVAFTANGFVSRLGWSLTQGFDDVVELFRGKADGDVTRADEFVEPVTGWLRDHQRPFFAYVHLVQPHEPYNAAPAEFYADLPAYSGPYDGSQEQMLRVFHGDLHPGRSDIEHIRGLYERNLRYADHAVGRIVDALRQLDLLERTIVIVAADHGESLGERGTFGHGNSVDAEQISIPLIVRLPAALGVRGRRGDEVGVIDLMPTLLGILGVPGPPGMVGRNLFDATSDGWPRSLISVAGNGAVSVVARGFKYSLERSTWREWLMRLPAQEDGPNVSWEYPVTFAYLASEAQRMLRPAAPRAKQPAPELPAGTRKALGALGYVDE